ncbi:MAG: hypothetical protein ACK56I_01260, partial [bacterium]
NLERPERSGGVRAARRAAPREQRRRLVLAQASADPLLAGAARGARDRPPDDARGGTDVRRGARAARVPAALSAAEAGRFRG